MLVKAILAPLFLQVALTLALAVALGRSRVGAIRGGRVRIADIALGQQAWPDSVTKIGNAYRNQFELPVLFYVAVVVAATTANADIIAVALAWAFVALRIVHVYVHVTSNHVPTRFNAFVAGFAVLVLMWAYLAAKILAAGFSP